EVVELQFTVQGARGDGPAGHLPEAGLDFVVRETGHASSLPARALLSRARTADRRGTDSLRSPGPPPRSQQLTSVRRAGRRDARCLAMTTETAQLVDLLAAAVGSDAIAAGDEVSDDYGHDEALTITPVRPAAVVWPTTTEQVAAVLRVANEHRVPVTARGAGTGMSGACTPLPGGIVVSFERMDRIVEIDEQNHVAVVEPGVRLTQLDDELAARGLVY